MILISLLVPPRVKNCTPHFSKCGGYKKIRESRFAPLPHFYNRGAAPALSRNNTLVKHNN